MPTVRKTSKKRQALLDALCATDEHPSAEWLYAKLKPHYPDLSLGTVYRNLALFRDEGLIISVGTVNGQERFDAKTSPHAHFMCSGCGAVLDLGIPLPETDRMHRLCKDAGCEMSAYQLSFSGLCPKCRGTQQ